MNSFWIGPDLQNFLIKGLNLSTTQELLGLCIVLLLISMIAEGIRTFRDLLMTRFVSKRREFLRSINGNGNLNSVRCRTLPVKYSRSDIKSKDDQEHNWKINTITTSSVAFEKNPLEENVELSIQFHGHSNNQGQSISPNNDNISNFKSELCHRKQNLELFAELLLSSVLHMLYILCGYTIMLAIMTFNFWIFLSVVLGSGSGSFVFRKGFKIVCWKSPKA